MAKRVLIGVGAVVLLLAATAAFVFYTAFGHNRPIEDGGQPAQGIRTVKDGFVSIQVLDAGKGHVALIDVGNDKSGEALLAELKRRGLGPEAVTTIFLTHGHPNHTAACGLFPNAAVYAGASDVEMASDRCKGVKAIGDGEVVNVDQLKVEAFAVPGHTAGSMVYLADGSLFFGDSAGGGKDGKMMPAVRLFSKSGDQNVAALKALEAKLEPRASEIKVLSFAHTGPLQGFAPFKEFTATH